jgi:SAM-dependent methyltransferase
VTEATEAEFGTIAEWTAQVATDLGPDHHVPAACRGSGSPAALDWLIEKMGLAPDTSFLDCGAGVGGPAAYVARSHSVRPVLVEPEAAACRAARKLFDFPVVCAEASKLPMADSSFDAAWSLGVLCTTPDQLALLRELGRTVRLGGYIGLLVFVAHDDKANELESNYFPTSNGLSDLVNRSALHIEEWLSTADLPEIPEAWNARVETVTQVLTDRHGHTRAWRLAEQQSSTIGRLLNEGALTGELLVLRNG